MGTSVSSISEADVLAQLAANQAKEDALNQQTADLQAKAARQTKADQEASLWDNTGLQEVQNVAGRVADYFTGFVNEVNHEALTKQRQDLGLPPVADPGTGFEDFSKELVAQGQSDQQNTNTLGDLLNNQLPPEFQDAEKQLTDAENKIGG